MVYGERQEAAIGDFFRPDVSSSSSHHTCATSTDIRLTAVKKNLACTTVEDYARYKTELLTFSMIWVVSMT